MLAFPVFLKDHGPRQQKRLQISHFGNYDGPTKVPCKYFGCSGLPQSSIPRDFFCGNRRGTSDGISVFAIAVLQRCRPIASAESTGPDAEAAAQSRPVIPCPGLSDEEKVGDKSHVEKYLNQKFPEIPAAFLRLAGNLQVLGRICGIYGSRVKNSLRNSLPQGIRLYICNLRRTRTRRRVP